MLLTEPILHAIIMTGRDDAFWVASPLYWLRRAAILGVGWRLRFYLSFLIITRVVTRERIIIKIDNISKSVMMITPFLL